VPRGLAHMSSRPSAARAGTHLPRTLMSSLKPAARWVPDSRFAASGMTAGFLPHRLRALIGGPFSVLHLDAADQRIGNAPRRGVERSLAEHDARDVLDLAETL